MYVFRASGNSGSDSTNDDLKSNCTVDHQALLASYGRDKTMYDDISRSILTYLSSCTWLAPLLLLSGLHRAFLQPFSAPRERTSEF